MITYTLSGCLFSRFSISSTSKTQPAQVPPPTSCRAAQRRVSGGSSGSGARSSRRRAGGQFAGAFFGAAVHQEVDGAFELHAVDADLDGVALAELADGAAGEGFGRDVADAGAGGDAAEAGVGDDGDVLAEVQVAQGGGDLEGLFHARAHGAAAHQDEDIASLDAAGLDGRAWRPSRCGRRARGRSGGRRRSHRPRRGRWRCS